MCRGLGICISTMSVSLINAFQKFRGVFTFFFFADLLEFCSNPFALVHFPKSCWDALMCVLSRCSVMSNSATPWTVACQALLSKGLSPRILEWVAISCSMEFSWPRDRTRVSYVSCNGRQVFTSSAIWKVWLREIKPELCNQEGWEGVGGRREVQERRDICIPVSDSCCYMAETNTIL